MHPNLKNHEAATGRPPKNFGAKAKDCFRLVSLKFASGEWINFYTKICAKCSEKAVLIKLEELINKGYMDCGTSARGAWLTEKGKEAFQAIKNDAP
jgi:hypothetical protein